MIQYEPPVQQCSETSINVRIVKIMCVEDLFEWTSTRTIAVLFRFKDDLVGIFINHPRKVVYKSYKGTWPDWHGKFEAEIGSNELVVSL